MITMSLSKLALNRIFSADFKPERQQGRRRPVKLLASSSRERKLRASLGFGTWNIIFPVGSQFVIRSKGLRDHPVTTHDLKYLESRLLVFKIFGVPCDDLNFGPACSLHVTSP